MAGPAGFGRGARGQPISPSVFRPAASSSPPARPGVSAPSEAVPGAAGPVRPSPWGRRTRLPAGLEARGPARPREGSGAWTPGARAPPPAAGPGAPQAREEPPAEGDAGRRGPAAAVGPLLFPKWSENPAPPFARLCPERRRGAGRVPSRRSGESERREGAGPAGLPRAPAARPTPGLGARSGSGCRFAPRKLALSLCHSPGRSPEAGHRAPGTGLGEAAGPGARVRPGGAFGVRAPAALQWARSLPSSALGSGRSFGPQHGGLRRLEALNQRVWMDASE